jgi:hypothetical protein
MGHGAKDLGESGKREEAILREEGGDYDYDYENENDCDHDHDHDSDHDHECERDGVLTPSTASEANGGGA